MSTWNLTGFWKTAGPAADLYSARKLVWEMTLWLRLGIWGRGGCWGGEGGRCGGDGCEVEVEVEVGVLVEVVLRVEVDCGVMDLDVGDGVRMVEVVMDG